MNGRLREDQFSKEFFQSKFKNPLTATTICEFLFGVNKVMKVGVFFNNAEIKQ